jgi:hypothetical protein
MGILFPILAITIGLEITNSTIYGYIFIWGTILYNKIN